ncbi:transposase [Nitrosococcus oceani]|uniref:transposase n=1 Tax=Nitrosococcus oceani TaxID=1229 RepID=UPI001E402698|nr:transposase [Nitrosococcus oceani]
MDPWFASSKTCHIYQHKMDAMTPDIRSWVCLTCPTHHNRDINAALNIQHQGMIKLKAEGLPVPAHGGLRKSGRSSVAA